MANSKGKPTGKPSGKPTPGQQAVEAILRKAHELNLGLTQPESRLIQKTPAPRDEGYWQHFQLGWVYWSPHTGAHMVTGAIFAKWAELQWEQGFLGFPISDELRGHSNSKYNDFEGGSIIITPRGGVYVLHAPTRDKWKELGGYMGFPGFPVADDHIADDGIGRYCVFENGKIYWSPNSGAHAIHPGDYIYNKWNELGNIRSPIGYPMGERMATPDRQGYYTDFEHGAIYWTPLTGTHVIQGSIYSLWKLPEHKSALGYPLGDQMLKPLSSIWYQNFQHGYIIDDSLGIRAILGPPYNPITNDASPPSAPDMSNSSGLPVGEPRETQEAPVISGSPFRMDFHGIMETLLAEALLGTDTEIYLPGPPYRLDFQGTTSYSPSSDRRYVAGPPFRIDFQGEHTI